MTTEPKTWIEIIHIKAYSSVETSELVKTFYGLVISGEDDGLGDVTLLRDYSIQNDFFIRLTWHGVMPENGKSALGFQLAQAFSAFGFIYHSVWTRETSLFIPRERSDSRPTARATALQPTFRAPAGERPSR